MTTMDTDDHERWAELAAGHVLSALDEADEATYLEHASTCSSCQQLERELSETIGELAHLPAQAAPPPSLRASIMRAVSEDDEKHTAEVVSITQSRGRTGHRPAWLVAAAAAAVVIVAGSVAWGLSGHKQESVAARCAKVHCPTVALDANGAQVATVMVLDQTAYLLANGLPATPSGHSYVLWRISNGKAPVGVAAVSTRPTGDPVKVGSIAVPVSEVATFAVSEEPGDSVPAAPTHLLASGNIT